MVNTVSIGNFPKNVLTQRREDKKEVGLLKKTRRILGNCGMIAYFDKSPFWLCPIRPTGIFTPGVPLFNKTDGGCDIDFLPIYSREEV